MMSQPPPLSDYGDNIFDADDDNEDIFASAIQDKVESKLNPLPELPTLQLSVDVSPMTSPVEELNQDSSLPGSTPVQNDIPTTRLKIQNGEIEDHHFINIRVKDGLKHGDGMAAYILYRVETHTNIPTFRKNSFCVQRRFSDFLGLHDKLVDKYLRSGRIIPPAPQKNVIGSTKIKMSGQAEQNSPSDFVERRRASLERYLQRTAAHPVLCMDSEFKEFLTNDCELPRATNTSALSGAGVMRLFNKVGETVNKITYRMDENDLWFEEKTQEIECLESGLRKLHTNVESLVIARKDMAACTGGLGKTVAMLSSCEEHGLLASSLARLHSLQEEVENLHNNQANTDFSILCELLKDYISLIGAIRCVFHERVKVYQHWNHSLQMLNKKREYKAKMELSNRSDKGNLATHEIAEWEAKVERCEEEFNNISKMIKKEMESFTDTRIKEFKSMFIKYMEQQMKHQMQLIEYWENFLPDAKAIA